MQQRQEGANKTICQY